MTDQTSLPPQPSRIEVDAMDVQVSKSRRNTRNGILAGAGLAVALSGSTYTIGYAARESAEMHAGRERIKSRAAELSAVVVKARDTLNVLAEKMESGSRSLASSRRFPDTLSTDLSGLNVGFDGGLLADIRGFPRETTYDLLELVTAVQRMEERKELIAGLLVRFQKPITEQLAGGRGEIGYVVTIDRDPSGNQAGFLSSLVTPIGVTSDNVALPPRLIFTDPRGAGYKRLPPYTGGDIATRPAAIYVVSRSFDSVCPGAQSGQRQIAQLMREMGDFVRLIKGVKEGVDEDVVQNPEPGLVGRADKLVEQLKKI